MDYNALPDSRSIRLLALLPSATEDVIRCHLETISLDSFHDYEALSYVWGDPIFNYTVECSGHTIQVTKNLQDALRHLRYPSMKRHLWIDQLCINQRDLSERAQQVCLMGDIYIHASSVAVWLGDADADTETTWRLLHSLQPITAYKTPQVYQLVIGAAETFDDAPNDFQTGASRALPPLPPDILALPKGTSEEWKAMDRFFKRSWFFRMWTYQEVVLSGKCEIHCGGFHMSWDDFSRGMTALRIAGYGAFVTGGRHLADDANIQKEHHATGKRATLVHLLSICRSREATNPRDRVYGVLGLVDSRTASTITVDYARSVAEVFAEGVRACIAEQNSLEIFTHIEVRRIDDHGLPSWVPDWRFKGSTRVSLGMRNSNGHRYFNAAGDTEPVLVPTDSWKKLGLRGFLVTQITRFVDVRTALRLDDPCIAQSSLSSSRWSPKFWSKMYRSAVELLQIPQSCVKQQEELDHFIAFLWKSVIREPPTAEDQLETAFRHTLMADLFPRINGHCVDDGHFPAYQSWEYHYFRRDVPPQVLLEHDQFAIDAMFNRELFIAGKEPDCYMGIALGIVKEGDWIVILEGGDTPFVLRPHAQTPTQSPMDVVEWEFIADCYVHGLMDGEAMHRTTESGFVYKTFVLV